jgi:hypothetical protein
MPRSLRSLLLATLVSLAAPVAATAAPPWSAPLPIGGTAGAAGTPAVVFTAAGHGLAAYSTVEFSLPLVHATTLHASASTGGAAFGPVRTLAPRLSLRSLATYGSDHVIAFGTTGLRHPRPAVSYGSPFGSFASPKAIGPAIDGNILSAAANARGDAAALLIVGRTPYLVMRRAGGSFGHAVRLDRGPTISGAVSVNARGDVLVVWERPVSGQTGTRAIYSRLRTAAGHLGAARKLGTGVPFLSIGASLGDGDRALVAWLGQRVSEGDAEGPATIKFVAAAAGHALGTAKTVAIVDVTGSGRYVTAPGVRTAINADGTALLAWTSYDDDHFIVRAAPLNGTTLGDRQTISDPATDTVLAGLTSGPSGADVVLGREGIRGNDPIGNPAAVTLVAAARAAGATAFGPLETVKQSAGYIETPGLAFDPLHGNAVAVWSDFPASALLASARAAL